MPLSAELNRAASAARGSTACLAVAVLTVLAGCAPDAGDDPDADAATPSASSETTAWLIDATTALGVDFVHASGAQGQRYMPESIGPGLALLDADGDGDLDLYLVNGGTILPDGRTAGDHANRLYESRDGRFVDVTAESGLGDTGYGMGATVGDVDNDGDPDVYVTNYGPDRLYLNRGDGAFDDATDAAGIDVPGWSCSAAFLDYDRDGFLDLFITHYVDYDPTQGCFDQAGRGEYCGPKVFPPVPDVLLRNNGDGTFIDVSVAAGIASVAAAGLGVVCADLNDDGLQDVYVANDAYENHLWLNRGDGTFRESAVMLGAAFNINGQPEAGMGVVAADLDGDAIEDLFVTHLSIETNTYYRNRGGLSGFVDATGESGLGASSMAFTGFGVAALDVELDGDLDLVITNGRVFRSNPYPGAVIGPPWDAYAEPNLFYLNTGGGRFAVASAEAGSFVREVEVTRAVATGDLDADGDLDFVITNIEGPARIYLNDAPRRGRWLAVRATDPSLRREAIGARVTVVTTDRRVARTITRAFGYLASSDPTAHFGLGAEAEVERIEVRWPDGLVETFPAADLDRVVEVVRGEGATR